MQYNELIIECLASSIGTMAFALLFSVPKNEYPYCGFIGLAGWLAYSLLNMCMPEPAGIFLAASTVVILSRIFAVRRKCPASIFMVPGLFPLVPGAGIYWAVYGLVSSDGAELANRGAGALSDAVAIVLGIIIVSELPQSIFSFIGKKHFFK